MNLNSETIEKIKLLPGGNIADNNNGIYHQGVMDSAIKPVNRNIKLVGRAYPISCRGGDNLALHQGIYKAKKGDILIVDLQGNNQSGHFGDIMTTAAKLRGLTGIILDGSIRDTNEILESGFPVFSRGSSSAGTGKQCILKENEEVVCGGIKVKKGDLIFADYDGVIVIPKENEDLVIEKAFNKYNKEKEIIKLLESGKTTLEIYGFDNLIKGVENNSKK